MRAGDAEYDLLRAWYAQEWKQARSTAGYMAQHGLMHVKHPRRVGPITARPTAEVRSVTREEPDLGPEHIRRIGRRLDAMPHEHREVFNTYFSDACEVLRTAMPKQPHVIVLLDLVAGGREVIAEQARKESRKAAPISAEQRLKNVAEAATKSVVDGAKLGNALTQANNKWLEACAAWYATAALEQRKVGAR